MRDELIALLRANVVVREELDIEVEELADEILKLVVGGYYE